MKIEGKEIIDNANDIQPGEAFFSFGSAKKSKLILKQIKISNQSYIL